jgi:hypothetical protein
MIYRSEASCTHSQVRFVNQLSQLQVALTEISVAALTTEPELRDMARSLISLAKYHSQKMTGSIVGAMEVEGGDRSMCLARS